MLLTLTTTHNPATDLGYLLHKNPAKLHSLELSFGKAHVFYPEATTDTCTAACRAETGFYLGLGGSCSGVRLPRVGDCHD